MENKVCSMCYNECRVQLTSEQFKNEVFCSKECMEKYRAVNGEMQRKRIEADSLTVQMLECNKMVQLCSDLRDALNLYRTPLLNDETARMFFRFEKYVHGMYESIMDEFKKKKCEVLNKMTGDKVKYPDN